MEESNSNSSKDMGDHVMADPSEAGTPRGEVTILGPSSQPGTPCSDLMVPTASHTPLPPSHTPGPTVHAPGVPMGHLSHGGVLTTAHSTDLPSVHTLGLSVPASLPPSTSMVNLTPTQISLGYSLSSPIGSLSSSISGQLSANTISSVGFSAAPLEGLHSAHTLPPVSGLMQRVVTQGNFSDLSPLPPGQGMVLPAVNTIQNMTYGSTYSVDSSTPAPYHYGGGHSQMTLGSNYRQELEAVLARMQEKDMQQEKQRQRRETEDHHLVGHHSKHLEQHHAIPAAEAEDLSVLDQGMHHQHMEYATYLPKPTATTGPPLEANDARMGHLMQDRTTNHTPDHLHMSHPASPMPTQTANHHDHRLALQQSSALPGHMTSHHRMTESPIAQGGMDNNLQTLPSHLRHEAHLHPQMALLNPDDRLRMELANVHRDAQAYIKPSHSLMQGNEDVLDEDVSTDLDQQPDQNLDPDGRTMDLSEPWQDRRSLQSHWLHYFPWLMISDDKFFCRTCLAAGMEIVFAKGRELYDEEHMDKELFIKHQQSSLHRDAEHRLGMVEHTQLPPPILQIPLPLGNNASDLVMKDHTLDIQQQQQSQQTTTQTQQQSQQPPQHAQQPHQDQVIIDVTPTPLQNPVVTSASVRDSSETILPPRKRANELSAQAISNSSEEIATQVDSTNCSVIRNLPLEKKGLGNRSIHERWFLDFPWLVYLVKENEFYCHICREGKADTQYASGVPAKCPKKSNFMNHEKTFPHREAANRLGLPSAIKKGAYTAMPTAAQDDTEEETSAVACRRKIRADWFVDFPWLEINRYHMLFTCFFCKKYKQPGVFTTGKSIANPKKDNFSKHEETEGHKLAVLMASGLSHEEAKNSLMAGTDLQLETTIGTDQDDDLEDRNECGELSSIFPGPVSESDNAVIDMVYNNLRGYGNNKLLNFFQMKQGPQNRRVQLEWFLDYPWLELHKERKVFLCKYCRVYHPYGSFVSGKPINNPKKTDLDKHQDTEGHKFAMRTHSADETSDERDDLKAENIGAIDGTTVTYMSDDFSTVMVLAKQTLFLQHPWLQHDPEENSYFCALCRELFDHQAFISHIQKEDLVRHETSDGHRQAVITQVQNKHAKNRESTESTDHQYDNDGSEQSNSHQKNTEEKKNQNLDDPKILPFQEAFWHYASQLQKLGILCDITLIVHDRGPRGGKHSMEFKAHKVLLVCASGYFKDCLKDAMLDNKYIFDNISGKGLGGILSYIYGRLSEVTPDAYEDCSVAAEILLMPQAKEYFNEKHKNLNQAKSQTQNNGAKENEGSVEKTTAKSETKRNRKSKAKRKSTPTKRSVDAMESVQTSSIPVYITPDVDSSPHNKKRKHREAQQQAQQQEQQRLLQKQQQEEQQKYDQEQQKQQNYDDHQPNQQNYEDHQAHQQNYDDQVDHQQQTQTYEDHQQQQKYTDQQQHLHYANPPQDQHQQHPQAQEQYERHLQEEYEDQQRLLQQEKQRQEQEWLQEQQQRLQEQQQLEEQQQQQQQRLDQQQLEQQRQLQEQQRLEEQQRLQDQHLQEQHLQEQHLQEQHLQEQQHLEQQEKEYLRQQQLHEQQIQEQIRQQQLHQQELQQQLMQEQQLQAEQLQQQPDEKQEEVTVTDLTNLNVVEDIVTEVEDDYEDYRPKKIAKVASTNTRVSSSANRVSSRAAKHSGKKPKSKWKTEEIVEENLVENMADNISDNMADNLADNLAESLPDNLADNLADDVDDNMVETLSNNSDHFDKKSFSLNLSNSGGAIEREIPNYEYASERKRQLSKYLPSCDICGKKFLRKGCIERHKQKFHANNQMRPSFACPDCDRLCPSKHDLKLHRRIHTNERPYSCKDCPKKFTRKETLIEHQYIHRPDNEKPHRCTVCSKGFFKIYDLQRHYTGVHSGKKPFTCDLCGKSFPWARSLADHIDSHKGPDRVRPYKCEDCRMTFVRKYDLKRHTITHTQEKPYACEWCGHGFTQKGSRDKHKRDFCRERPGGHVEEEDDVKIPQQQQEPHQQQCETVEPMQTDIADPQGQGHLHQTQVQGQIQGQVIDAATATVPQQNGEFDNLIENSSSQYFPTTLIFYTE